VDELPVEDSVQTRPICRLSPESAFANPKSDGKLRAVRDNEYDHQRIVARSGSVGEACLIKRNDLHGDQHFQFLLITSPRPL
jgi:hypothetical protein